ncbi:glycosyltransferase family 2 protein [Halostella sp. JP-L12]|uniref:glycosyltransferase family 2 protein n=1 Tax=Halostella TaxID=1843185 RepID=UPI000EF77E4C|nr:glycosyltransferase family 2 protein [Halostella sp. JP-L12]
MSSDSTDREAQGPDVEPLGRESTRHAETPFLSAESDVTPTLSIVMPTLNEEDGIRECIHQIEAAVQELGVTAEVIVSDSSTDRTPEIAHELGAIVITPDQPGYGYAYRYAFEHARGRYIAMGDADTTYDFAEIPRLLRKLVESEADIVMGSRLNGEIKPGAMPTLHQYIGNPLLTRFLNTFYGVGISDAHSGFRLFTQEALDMMDLKTDGMEFASEMVMEAGSKGLSIEEVPIVYHERKGEETLDSFQDGWRHVRFMLMNAPGYLFSIPALGLCLLGVATMIASVFDSQLVGITFGTHTVIAGSLLTIAGYQMGNLALFSTVTDTIRKPRDPITTWITDNVRLEHGVTMGTALIAGGSAYVAYMLVRWLETGSLPFVIANMLAFTAIIVGIQTIFSSFFFSMLRKYC